MKFQLKRLSLDKETYFFIVVSLTFITWASSHLSLAESKPFTTHDRLYGYSSIYRVNPTLEDASTAKTGRSPASVMMLDRPLNTLKHAQPYGARGSLEFKNRSQVSVMKRYDPAQPQRGMLGPQYNHVEALVSVPF